MTTNGQRLQADAERIGIPRRTLADVKATMARAKLAGSGVQMARLMLRHGRLTEAARAFLKASQT
jgi:hypothetical protein